MGKDCECYEEEVQPYRKTDYKPIIYIYIFTLNKTCINGDVGKLEGLFVPARVQLQ